MERRLIYLGGNGHCAARLSLARDNLTQLAAKGMIAPFELIDVPYPGFEDRPPALSFEAFLASVSGSIAAAVTPSAKALLYGTGIGGLLALCLRARGEWLELPFLLQAPVLWGLEHRWMPRIMRWNPARLILHRLFALDWFQRRFLRKQFERPLPPVHQEAFFQGYARCSAAADFFAWLTPALLRRLERQFAARPGALNRISVWWGGRDGVVHLQELAWTEQALGVCWPVRTFPHWGHYPMIDDPEEWIRALSDVLATPEAIPGPVGSEAQ